MRREESMHPIHTVSLNQFDREQKQNWHLIEKKPLSFELHNLIKLRTFVWKEASLVTDSKQQSMAGNNTVSDLKKLEKTCQNTYLIEHHQLIRIVYN